MFEEIILHFVVKDIHKHFGFLFEKGYRIRDAYLLSSHSDWCVELESKDCIIWILWSRFQAYIGFTPVFGSRNSQRIMLEEMIYYLSNHELFIENSPGNYVGGKKKQLKREAGLLAEYVDQIAPYFSYKYYECKDDLAEAARRYGHRTSTKY